MLIQDFNAIVDTLVRTRNLNRSDIVEVLKKTIEEAVKSYYKTDAEVSVDRDSIKITIHKKVVKNVKNPSNEISIEEAKKYDPDAIEGSQVRITIDAKDLPRAVVYRIQNRFINDIKNIERKILIKDFEHRVGELVRGKVQRINRRTGTVLLSIEVPGAEDITTEGIIPSSELIPGEIEKFRQGETKRAVILGVDNVKYYVILSRTHPDFLKRLLEIEIPDIQDGTIEIKQVARIPGKRAKVAVYSKLSTIDPVAAIVGTRGIKVTTLQRELHNEKVDIVRWDPDIIKFAINALQPAPVITAYIHGDKIYAVVDDEHVREAKGAEGMNVILASKLVGKDIQIVPFKEYRKPKGVVTLIDISRNFPASIVEYLRKAGYYSFSEVPTLASLYKAGLDEKTALKLIEFIEENLDKEEKEPEGEKINE